MGGMWYSVDGKNWKPTELRKDKLRFVKYEDYSYDN